MQRIREQTLKIFRQRLVLGLLFGFAACEEFYCDDIQSEEGQLRLSSDLIVRPYEAFQSGQRILAGATYCPKLAAYYHPEEETFHEDSRLSGCFTGSLSGPASYSEDACIHFGQEDGEVVWTLLPQSCEIQQEGIVFQEDRVRFLQTSREHIQASFDLNWRERAVEELMVAGPATTFPQNWYYDPEQVVQVITGQSIFLPVVLQDVPSQEIVAWAPSQGVLKAQNAENQTISFDQELAPEMFASQIQEGNVEVQLMVDHHSLSIGNIQGVSPAKIHSLELVAIYEPAPADTSENTWGPPFGVRAIVRDAQGQLLHAAPVAWKITSGRLAVEPGSFENDARTPDYAFVTDACEPPPKRPTERNATIEASVGELRTTLELVWTAPAKMVEEGEMNMEEDFTPSQFCQGPGEGCQCTAGGSSTPSAFLMIVLGLWGMHVRRPMSRKGYSSSPFTKGTWSRSSSS